MKQYIPGKNISVLYLALISVLYYILTSGIASPTPPALHTNDTKYIEIEQDGISNIYTVNSTEHHNSLSDIYNINLQDGIKLIFIQDRQIRKSRISGIKSLSLGVPIAVNSASKEDLMALPGIGEVTASSIIKHRENFGKFTHIDELDNVPGIGPKTIENLDGKVSLD